MSESVVLLRGVELVTFFHYVKFGCPGILIEGSEGGGS